MARRAAGRAAGRAAAAATGRQDVRAAAATRERTRAGTVGKEQQRGASTAVVAPGTSRGAFVLPHVPKRRPWCADSGNGRWPMMSPGGGIERYAALRKS
eukprot:5558650-Prymnesium_polylepis.1